MMRKFLNRYPAFGLEGETIDTIPNEEKDTEKEFRAGTSNVVSVPPAWRKRLRLDGGPVEKRLIKVEIPSSINPVTKLVGYCMIIAEEGFPFEVFEKVKE